MISEELIYYLKTNKVGPQKIQAETRNLDNLALPKRNLFVKLKQYAKGFFEEGIQPRMVALSGLRGVGKTTLMWQIAEEIFNRYTQNIYFINVDFLSTLNENLSSAFLALQKEVLGKPFHAIQEPIVFLFDEVHDTKDWDKHLKILYDECPHAFILCTGSSALLLHKSPDLATRWTLIRLFPFRFAEFVLAKSWVQNPQSQIYPVKGLGKELKQLIFFSENVEEVKDGLKAIVPSIQEYLQQVEESFSDSTLTTLIDEYISYHNIARFLQIKNKELINERVIALFERIMFKDIPSFTNIQDVDRMFRLLMRLALSSEANFHKLANNFQCKESEIERMITSLNKAEILNVMQPYGGVKTKTGQTLKAFFMSPSLRRALYSQIYGSKLEADLRAKLYEDIVAMYFKRTLNTGLVSIGHNGNFPSPDFVIETRNQPIVLEVGAGKSSSRQVNKYEKVKRYGIIVNATASNFSEKDNCIIIPLSWFLLL